MGSNGISTALTATLIVLAVGVLIAVTTMVVRAYQRRSGDEAVKAIKTVDGNVFRVLQRENAEEAAELLADITRDVSKLVKHMVDNKLPNRYLANRLAKRWYRCNRDRTCIREISTTGDALAWILGKDTEIGICLRNAFNTQRFDAKRNYNTAMFVILHELGHMMSNSYLHCDEFQKSFASLVDIAALPEVGIYNKVDYTKARNSQVYCGGVIKSTPPDDGAECELNN